MQIKEKRTGKLIETDGCIVNGPGFTISLETFAERYEIVPSAEKPKKYWHIFGTSIVPTPEGDDEVYDRKNKEIGNYFETKEEAEKAVEKLKAWKRLKDKGFINEQVFSMNLNWCNPDNDDWKAFKLLFGDE